METTAPLPPSRALWHVELGVEGHAWRHAWRGWARDSLDATEHARESLFGPTRVAGRVLPVRVLECCEVRT